MRTILHCLVSKPLSRALHVLIIWCALKQSIIPYKGSNETSSTKVAGLLDKLLYYFLLDQKILFPAAAIEPQNPEDTGNYSAEYTREL